jgi:hypothetical protein
MSSWALAAVLKPMAFLLLFALPVYLVQRWLPPGFLKRVLLFQIHDEKRYTIKESWRQLFSK